jgi:hypothetical protein
MHLAIPPRRVSPVSDATILELYWPDDLDPGTVSFTTRTETVLRRRGLYDDPAGFNTLTVAEVAGWWNTGPVTIANLRTITHSAIRRHHEEAGLRARIDTVLKEVAIEPWAPQVRFWDPRFTDYLPKSDATVHDIATSRSIPDRQFLFDRLGDLRAAIDKQATLSLTDAVAEYVELITGQHGARLEVLLARAGLNGQDPIARAEAGRRLGVSYQRIYQLEQQLQAHRDRAMPPGGIWMPQVGSATNGGWTEAAVDRVTAFIAPHS